MSERGLFPVVHNLTRCSARALRNVGEYESNMKVIDALIRLKLYPRAASDLAMCEATASLLELVSAPACFLQYPSCPLLLVLPFTSLLLLHIRSGSHFIIRLLTLCQTRAGDTQARCLGHGSPPSDPAPDGDRSVGAAAHNGNTQRGGIRSDKDEHRGAALANLFPPLAVEGVTRADSID